MIHSAQASDESSERTRGARTQGVEELPRLLPRLSDGSIILILALLVLLVCLSIPSERLLMFALEHHAHHIDHLVTACVVMCFVLMIFFIKRSHRLNAEVRTRLILFEQLEERSCQDAQMSEMARFLQSCGDQEEASRLIAHYAKKLLPGESGNLYVFRNSRDLLEATAAWGDDASEIPTILPHQCWALRQGNPYLVAAVEEKLPCPHVEEPTRYACVPMMAHGEVLALLHMRFGKEAALGDGTARIGSILYRFAETLSLSLSNLRLRETLRQQSIRDPLTGLFNRRYLEETLTLEIERAKRSAQPLSVIMLDIDHFKRFNDTHGHSAGDAVLRTLARFLVARIRAGDIACRYGGEEFTLILPNSSLETAERRAFEICEGIRTLNVDVRGQTVGPLTMSLGVAMHPTHGDKGLDLLEAADRALYRAKSEGRDRVVAAAG